MGYSEFLRGRSGPGYYEVDSLMLGTELAIIVIITGAAIVTLRDRRRN